MKLLFAFLILFATASNAYAITDSEIRQAMIKRSVDAYPGNCPCPYNRDSRGNKCGKRSAYVKPGGYSPFCYPKDIPDDMVRLWRLDNEQPYKLGDEK